MSAATGILKGNLSKPNREIARGHHLRSVARRWPRRDGAFPTPHLAASAKVTSFPLVLPEAMDVATCIVVCGGITMPVRLSSAHGRHIASSIDWREARDGPTPCDALQALSVAVEERVLRAIAEAVSERV